jgi:hypothetical protein
MVLHGLVRKMMVGSAGKVLNFGKHANNKKELCINTERRKSTPITYLAKSR